MKFKRTGRSVLAQVKSGLKISLAFVASLVTMALFGKGYELLIDSKSTNEIAIGLGLIICISALLAATLRYWRLWFCFIPSYLGLRFLGLFILLGLGAHYQSFSPAWAIGFPVMMFAMAYLSFRFGKKRQHIAQFESISLFSAGICLLLAISNLFLRGPNEQVLIYSACANVDLLAPRVWTRHSPLSRKRRNQVNERREAELR